jgi:hypothetical protein
MMDLALEKYLDWTKMVGSNHERYPTYGALTKGRLFKKEEIEIAKMIRSSH